MENSGLLWYIRIALHHFVQLSHFANNEHRNSSSTYFVFSELRPSLREIANLYNLFPVVEVFKCKIKCLSTKCKCKFSRTLGNSLNFNRTWIDLVSSQVVLFYFFDVTSLVLLNKRLRRTLITAAKHEYFSTYHFLASLSSPPPIVMIYLFLKL